MEENKPQINKASGDIKTIHTYLTDMAETVRDNEVSVIKIAMAEQKKHEREDVYKKAEGTSFSKTILIIGAIILIAGALFGVYYVIQQNKEKSAPITVLNTTNIEALISYDNQSFVDTTNVISLNDFTSLLKPETDKVNKPDAIASIFLTTSISGKPELLKLDNLISMAGLSAPSSLTRSLSGNYMVGTYTPSVVNEKTKPHLFLLFQVKDYNLVYAGMLEWEKTILDNMYSIFNIDVTGDRSQLFETPFKDIIVDNKDARILSDKDGNPVLYYIFIDKTNLVITDSQDTIKKIGTMLLLKKTKPL